MRSISAPLLSLAAISVAAGALSADEPASPAETSTSPRHSLRYQFADGKAFQYSISNESTIEVQVGGVSDSVEQQTKTTTTFRVKSGDGAGHSDLEATIDRVQLSATVGGQRIEWDSDSNDPPPEGLEKIKESIGTPRGTVRTAPSGKVVDVEFAANGVSAAELKESHLDILPLLPEQPVRVGETWTETFSVDVITEDPPYKKPIQMQRQYSLRSVEAGVATIDERTLVLTPIQDPKLEAQLIRRTPTGTSTIDINRGQLLSRKLNIDNRVVGFQGPNTLTHVVETRENRLLK